jgi:hypothetical protein
MANLKYYNETNSEWETLVIGKQGPSGIANATAPVTYDGGTQTVGLTDSFIGQTVRSYANAAARATAIPSPTVGMYTHLEDAPQRTEFWDGSAWRSENGLTLINTTSFTAQSTVDITNVFSAEYDNYRILVNAQLGSTASVGLRLRLLSNTTPATTGYNSNQVNYNLGTGTLQNISTATDAFLGGWVPASFGRIISIELGQPFIATATSTTGMYSGEASGSYAAWGLTGGMNTNSTSYNGLRLFLSSNTMTGTARIYGYRNA